MKRPRHYQFRLASDCRLHKLLKRCVDIPFNNGSNFKDTKAMKLEEQEEKRYDIYQIETKSTQKAQSSAAPNSRCVKQSLQVWHAPANCSLYPYPDNLWKSVIWFPVMLLTDTDSHENLEWNVVCKRLNEHSQNVAEYSVYQFKPILNIS